MRGDDYVYRKLTYLVITPNSKLFSPTLTCKEDALDASEVDLLDQQALDLEFQICMVSISLCRFLTDHQKHMPLTVTSRLLNTHDVLMTLVPLLTKAPWVRKRRGEFEKFEKNEWKMIEEDDLCTLPKLNVQVWLAIFNLIMDGENRRRYDMTNIRKDNLLKLRRFLNEVIFDQIPPLTELLRTLEELSITNQLTQSITPAGGYGTGLNTMASSNVSSAFLVEVVAEIREALVKTYEGRWQEVADEQMAEIFVKETKEEMDRLKDMISIPRFDDEEDGLDETQRMAFNKNAQDLVQEVMESHKAQEQAKPEDESSVA